MDGNFAANKTWRGRMLCCALLLVCLFVPLAPKQLGGSFQSASAQESADVTPTPAANDDAGSQMPVEPGAKPSTETKATETKASTQDALPSEIQPEVLSSDSAAAQAQAMRFYAMMEPNSPVPPHLQGFVKDHPELRKRIGFRPMMQWHFWANRPKPFGASFLFVFLFSLVFTSLAPNLSRAAQTVTRERYWRSLFVGGLAGAVVVWLVRMAVSTQFGWPMGVVLGGVLQISLMAGLSVITSLIGQSLAFYIRLEKWPVLADRPDCRRFAYVLLGSLVFAALLQIPGFGELPKIGTRLVGILAVIGVGALFIARRQSATAVQE